jgi:hypothetical protein
MSLNTDLHLNISKKHKLPNVKLDVAAITKTVHALREVQEYDDNVPMKEVVKQTMVAAFGCTIMYTRTKLHDGQGEISDSGANCCMTNNWKLLENVKVLDEPINIGMVIDNEGIGCLYNECKLIGMILIICDDEYEIRAKCF